MESGSYDIKASNVNLEWNESRSIRIELKLLELKIKIIQYQY